MWISLIGFNAVGKTTLAVRLGQAAGRRVVDLDQAVATLAHRSLPEIFAESGATSFRALERQALANLPADQPLIVATGGGTVEQRATMTLLAERGLVVWLDASWRVLRHRLAPRGGEAPSPVWEHLGEEGLAALYARRRPLFAAAARMRLEIVDREPAVEARRLLGAAMHLAAAGSGAPA
jgi:shikimate kinase